MKSSDQLLFSTNASSRGFEHENSDVIDRAYIATWKSAAEILYKRKILIGRKTYVISFDWSQMIRRHERYYSADQYIKRGGRENLSARFKRVRFPRRASVVPISVTVTGKDAAEFSGVAESALHDVFLIMNIATPGSCNFLYSKLSGKNKRQSEFSLSNYLFEISLFSDKRPQIKFVDLKKVADWYFAIRTNADQIPKGPTEKALFALLHLARLDGDIVSVIWIFYALESLLQTKPGENFSAIVRRLALLLHADQSEATLIRKELRKLYDIRSAIVHGGFEATHPMRHGGLDRRADDVFGSVLDAMDCGYRVLVAALQRMAENGWLNLSFNEVVGGIDNKAKN